MRAQAISRHIVLLLGVALLTIAYDSGRSADQRFEASPQAERDPGPIPLDGPLARPKSLEQIGVPVEATRAVAPADNPQTPEKIALGEKLFFEGRLSVDGTVACSTCHDPALAFTDGKTVSIGIKGRAGQRNARHFPRHQCLPVFRSSANRLWSRIASSHTIDCSEEHSVP